MKKVLSICFLFLTCMFVFTGCEQGNSLQTVSFSNITSAGSKDYTIKITFADDKRVDNKYYDIQIKADGDKKIRIGKEFSEKKEVVLSNEWKSLTTLLLDEPDTEQFTKGSDAITLIYIFNVEENAKVTFRAVVGGVEDNASKKGKIITSAEECSSEFVVNAIK